MTREDRIRPWDANPRYWQYKGKPVLLLGGTREDNLFQIPDLQEHLDKLVSVGGNYIRNTMSDRDEGNIYAYRQLDSGKYDLDQWNDEYWNRFKAMLQLTHERDIVVQIEVWDRFDLSDASGMFNWQSHPYNPANNINYSLEDTGLENEYLDHPALDKHGFYHSIPGMEKYQFGLDSVRNYQHRFVEKLLELSLPYGNVLYCMNNETTTEATWGQYWMQFITDRANTAGVDVCVTDMFEGVWKANDSQDLKVVLEHPELYTSVDISQISSRNFGEDHWNAAHWIIEQVRRHPRPVNHAKIYSDGQLDFGSGTPQDGIERFWRNLLAGAASVRFHRPPAGIALNEKSQACIRAARVVEKLVRLWDIQPHMELLSKRSENEAYLAADPGSAYVLFFSQGGSVKLNLCDADETMTLTWIDVSKGVQAECAQDLIGNNVTISAPADSPWVAVVQPKI